jgi:hypothetical protein
MLLALSLSSGVEKAGAYAGFAAILGLGVLSLLYFAQAREVKRLREWAGRAPERAREVEDQATARGRSDPPPPATTPAVRRIPSAPASPPTVAAPPAPVPSPAPPAGPSPALPVAAPAMMAAPALASATRYAPPEPSVALPSPVVVPEPKPESEPEPPAVETPAQTPDETTKLEPAVPAALTAAASRQAPQRPVPPRANGAGAPPPRRTSPLPRPRPEPLPDPAPSRSGGSTATVIGIVIALLVIAGGAFAAIQLLKGNGSATKGAPSSAARAAGRTTAKRSKPGAAFSGKGVTITVLNGTPVAGLAKRVGAQLVARGFTQGAVTNASDQARSATIVSFFPGHKADAERVSRALKGVAVEPIDPTTRGIACPNATCASTVVVTVGSDRAQ